MKKTVITEASGSPIVFRDRQGNIGMGARMISIGKNTYRLAETGDDVLDRLGTKYIRVAPFDKLRFKRIKAKTPFSKVLSAFENKMLYVNYSRK